MEYNFNSKFYRSCHLQRPRLSKTLCFKKQNESRRSLLDLSNVSDLAVLLIVTNLVNYEFRDRSHLVTTIMSIELSSIDNNDNASFLSLSSSVNSNIDNHATHF